MKSFYVVTNPTAVIFYYAGLGIITARTINATGSESLTIPISGTSIEVKFVAFSEMITKFYTVRYGNLSFSGDDK